VTYHWRFQSGVRSANLADVLNEAEAEGWEVFQVMACYAAVVRYDVLLRQRVPEAEPVELIQS
jgi:hypothetical protein